VRKYSVVVADRSTGLVRRFTLSLRPTLVTIAALASLPILMGLGARWSAKADIQQLRAANGALQVENASYRGATGELTSQIQSLEGVVDELGERAKLDPEAARAMQKLPAAVRSRAAGGPAATALSSVLSTSLTSPDDTFGVLRDLLQGLESRLNFVRRDVERREQLANATPSIWPTRGWLTDSFGNRKDPFTGEREFHTGLEISADKGEPVYATANGTVETAAASGSYGNMVVVSHGFGISTRYAHLDSFRVHSGDLVRRGEVVGYAGATGRATGDHLHYEVLVYGRQLNPLQFLLNSARP